MTHEFFAIYAEDHPDSLEKRQPLRAAHVARLHELDKAERLAMAGPLASPEGKPEGSLIVAQFTNLDEAEQWFAADPYVQAGIYARVTIKPFKKVFPHHE